MNKLPFTTANEAYDYMLLNPNSCYKEQAEGLIFKEPYSTFNYIKNVIKKRYKKAEHIF